MTPRELLEVADSLLRGGVTGMSGTWPRACAGLLRTALECTLDDFWRRRAPGVLTASMRTQLLVLPVLAGDEAGGTARGAWHGLCRAVHHHSYELPPTVAELRGWHRDVTTLRGLLRLD